VAKGHFVIRGSQKGQVIMASGWQSDGRGFKPQHLQTAFEPKLPQSKNLQGVLK